MIREGTTARNLHSLLPLITPENSRLCHFCSDDRHPDTLLSEGSVDDLVRKAITWGLRPVTAIQMATINTAEYFGLRNVGAIAPGYRADLLVLDDLDTVQVGQVYAAGRLVAKGGAYLPATAERPDVPIEHTVHLASAPIDFAIPSGDGPARVIGAIPDQVVTEDLRMVPTTDNGQVIADPDRDLLKVAVVERHHGSGKVGLGLVKGVGLKRGAIASSVAHDSHNIIVVGTDDDEMRAAVVAVADMGGGQVVVAGGEARAACPLPIAGLMSDRPMEEVRDQIEALNKAAHALGCTLPEPLMTMSFLALPVIPSLKLTDLGLVDVGAFDFVPLFGG
jgi:adenine deaminase